MNFRILIAIMALGPVSPVFSQNKTGQNAVADKPLHLVIDTLEYFASPYGKNLVPANYPGGKQAFINFLTAHMQLPGNLSISDTAQNNAVDHVYANFEIEKDGTVSGVNLVHNGKYKIDAELARCIKLSVWKPATINGQPVRGGYNIPIYIISK
jgi:hypothetical protein